MRKGKASESPAIRRAFVSDKGPGIPYKERTITENHPSRKRGMIVRSSTRWIESSVAPSMCFRFPYYNQLGKDTGHTLYKWKCKPASLVSSSIATIFHRLKQYCFRHNNSRVVFRNVGRLLKAATYYVISQNDWFWDRILYFSRNLDKCGNEIHRITLRMILKTDANKRFVYSHAIHQAQWLTLQAERPCDKSAPRRFHKAGVIPSGISLQCENRKTTVYDEIWEIATAISQVSKIPRGKSVPIN